MRGWFERSAATRGAAYRGSLRTVAIAAAMLAAGGAANAFQIDTGDEDLQMRLDSTASFTAGFRVRGRDDAIAANPALSASVASDYFADKGDLYTTRFDLFSEYDLKYKGTNGIRLSAAAWYDPSFPGTPKVGPAGPANSAFGAADKWPGEIRRFYESGAEILDAFAFTRLDLGPVPVSVKAGRTSIVWGQSLFGGVGGNNSVGYAQSPNDGRKSSQNPNASLKETSLPLAQVSLVFNVAENANLSVYRTLEWRPDRVPGSGTYMGFGDGVAGAPYLFCSQLLPYSCFPYGQPLKGKSGDWGVQFESRPSFLDASIALTYREFAEKAPWYAVWDVADNAPIGQARSVYGNDTKVMGLTFNTNKWDVSWAGEVSLRKNAALVSDFSALAPVAVGGANGPGGLFDVTPTQGARGDTMHALLNAQVFLGKAAFWDTFVVATEVAVSHLQKVTRDADLFQATGSGFAPVICNAPPSAGGAANRLVAGCTNRTATSFGLYLDPTIYQALPSVDVELPVFVQLNWRNSPLNGGSTDGFNTLSAGVKATWNTPRGPQVFQLNYLAFSNRTAADNPNGHAILGGPYYDRSQVQFTYTTSF